MNLRFTTSGWWKKTIGGTEKKVGRSWQGRPKKIKGRRHSNQHMYDHIIREGQGVMKMIMYCFVLLKYSISFCGL